MENIKPEYLDYKSMQELLPDYVFQRLSDEEKNKFEQSLPNYPDLQYEISDVRAVFYKVERMNFDENIEYRTRNMSVKVLNKLNSRKELEPWSRKALRFLIPTMALALAAYFYFDSNFFKSDKDYIILQNKDKETIASIYDDSNYLDYTSGDYENIDEHYSELQDITNLSQTPDNTLANLFASASEYFSMDSDSLINNENTNLKETNKTANPIIINTQELKNLGISEEDLQNLLEETNDENTI